jgi:hypothetical protein
MTDTLIYLGREFEIFVSSLVDPFFQIGSFIQFIMSSIEFNGIVMLYILVQKICFLGSFRINFSDPFLSSPFGTTNVYFRFFAFFPFSMVWLMGGSGGSLKSTLFNSFVSTLPKSIIRFFELLRIHRFLYSYERCQH